MGFEQRFYGILRDWNSLSNFSCSFSRHSKISLHNHQHITLKSWLTTIFRWYTCGLSKFLNGHLTKVKP